MTRTAGSLTFGFAMWVSARLALVVARVQNTDTVVATPSQLSCPIARTKPGETVDARDADGIC